MYTVNTCSTRPGVARAAAGATRCGRSAALRGGAAAVQQQGVRARRVVQPSRSRQLAVVARAERNSDSSFVTGFVLGGVVFGALGFLFAPQISKTLLGDDQRLKLPRFLDDDAAAKDPEATKQELIEKIAQLNASIDEVAAKLETSKVEVAA